MNPAPFKVCPQCNRQTALETQVCGGCGHQFRSNFTPPASSLGPVAPNQTSGFPGGPSYGQVPGPTMAFQGMGSGVDPLIDLARRHRDSNQVFIWTLIGGILCVWPLWIITYLEYVKMRDIKSEVARMGVDVTWWEVTYRAK